MKDDFNDLENINIEKGNIAENNDETSPDSLLKIEPIKSLDSSNIKIEIPKTETIVNVLCFIHSILSFIQYPINLGFPSLPIPIEIFIILLGIKCTLNPATTLTIYKITLITLFLTKIEIIDVIIIPIPTPEANNPL